MEPHSNDYVQWMPGHCPYCAERKQIVEGIQTKADEVWGQIDAGVYRHYGAVDPASVDPELAAQHLGLSQALTIARGDK